MNIRGLQIAAMAAASLACTPLMAAQHLMKITEVYVGPAGDSDAQFVELQMYTGGQNQVQGHDVVIYNAADTIVGTFTFGAAVDNGASQSYILIATDEAESRFGVTADLAMTPVITPAGGKACFNSFDCVSWGNYGGDSVNPSASGNPFNPGAGLEAGRAAQRDISAGNANQLEAGDDTGDSAADFDFGTSANPTNNAGEVGSDSGAGGGTGDGGSTGGGTPASGSDSGGDSGALHPALLLLLLLGGLGRRRGR